MLTGRAPLSRAVAKQKQFHAFDDPPRRLWPIQTVGAPSSERLIIARLWAQVVSKSAYTRCALTLAVCLELRHRGGDESVPGERWVSRVTRCVDAREARDGGGIVPLVQL